MELRRPKQCPKCGSSNFAEIVYGRPTSEALDAVDRGEIALGGCFIMPGQPDWRCNVCGHKWFEPDDPARVRRETLLNDLINDDQSNQEDEDSV